MASAFQRFLGNPSVEIGSTNLPWFVQSVRPDGQSFCLEVLTLCWPSRLLVFQNLFVEYRPEVHRYLPKEVMPLRFPKKASPSYRSKTGVRTKRTRTLPTAFRTKS